MTQPTSGSAPGWYINPDDSTTERYWTGGTFTPGSRPAQPGTAAAKRPTARPVEVPAPSVEQLLQELLITQRRANYNIGILTVLFGVSFGLSVIAGVIAVLATR